MAVFPNETASRPTRARPAYRHVAPPVMPILPFLTWSAGNWTAKTRLESG